MGIFDYFNKKIKKNILNEKEYNGEQIIMNYEADLFIKACSDPHGISDSCYPDGTPMTNREKYLRQIDRSNDFH